MHNRENLQDWLTWLEGLSPSAIDLGLERVQQTLANLALRRPATVITVAGTNGKGSSVAMLEAWYRSHGQRCGSYTSPHLELYNERIRIDAEPVDDAAILAAFERVDQARGKSKLTYFEFSTLAALVVFEHCEVDVVVLEVGLGGRLDAVNAIAADSMLITSVALDHQHWLGNDLDSIGAEKAGIMRAGRPVVFSARAMPASVGAVANGLGSVLFSGSADFFVDQREGEWGFHGFGRTTAGLTCLQDAGRHQRQNAAGVIALLTVMYGAGAITADKLNKAWTGLGVAGRQVWVPTQPEIVIDVAHNAAAVEVLRHALQDRPSTGATHVVCGLLADKNIAATLGPLADLADSWTAVPTAGPRGQTARLLAERLAHEFNAVASTATDVASAIAELRKTANAVDRIVILGSFSVAGPALEFLGL